MNAGNIGAGIPPEGFLFAMELDGLTPDPSKIIPGVFYRFPGAGKSKNNLSGWCKLFEDCRGGVYGDYSTGLNENWLDSPDKRCGANKNYNYREEVKKGFREAKEAREKATRARQEFGADNALKIWEAARPAPADHPYLIKKGVTGLIHLQLRLYQGPLLIRNMACNGALIVPAYNETGKLATLEFIQRDGEKRFLTGCKKGGSFFLIGSFSSPYETDKKIAGVVCVAEGVATGASIQQATGYPVAVAFDAGNLLVVSRFINKRHPEARLIVCADNDHHEDGKPNTGILTANMAAKATGGLLAIPDLFDGEKTDFNDMMQGPGGKERIRAIFAAVLDVDQVELNQADPADPVELNRVDPADPAELDQVDPAELDQADPADQVEKNKTTEAPEETVARLAELSPLGYDQVRQMEAERLGVRASTLDKEVARARGNGSPEESGEAVIFEEFEPWSDPVDGAALLDEMAVIFKRFVILPPHADTMLPLWCMFTYLSNYVDISPILNITSPEKRCGKSTLREVVGCMVDRPLTASNITTAALFRCVSLWHPTLLIDETDTFITKENEYLRGVINSGHTRSGARIMLNVGDDHEPRWFKTWCPKVLCGIGNLPDTVKDRSLLVELRRRVNDEPIEKLRYINQDIFEDIKRKCVRFTQDIRYKLPRHRPDMPALLHDRAADNWEPLFSIAHFAGGEWPERARKAALSLCGEEKEAISENVELLEDIKTIFASMEVDRIPTATLIECLCGNPEKPWATWNRGNPISSYQLAMKLKSFMIYPGSIRVAGTSTPKGYRLQQFQDAFTRYTQNTEK